MSFEKEIKSKVESAKFIFGDGSGNVEAYYTIDGEEIYLEISSKKILNISYNNIDSLVNLFGTHDIYITEVAQLSNLISPYTYNYAFHIKCH